MENSGKTQKSSKIITMLLLIPALLFGLISMALAVVGLGLIPIVPAMVGIILSGISFFVYKNNYRFFTRLVLGISILAVVISIFRGLIIEEKVAADKNFDTTVLKTQEGIDSDLNDAFSEDDSIPAAKKDTIGIR